MPTMKEIRDIARQLGIRPTRMEKAELIRAIQRAEGNFDCFGTAAGGSAARRSASGGKSASGSPSRRISADRG